MTVSVFLQGIGVLACIFTGALVATLGVAAGIKAATFLYGPIVTYSKRTYAVKDEGAKK